MRIMINRCKVLARRGSARAGAVSGFHSLTLSLGQVTSHSVHQDLPMGENKNAFSVDPKGTHG